MTRHPLVTACVTALLVAVVTPRPFAQQQELPRFTSSVEVTSLDVSVFDDRGRPVSDLTAADFVVRVDGAPRRVVSAEWVPLQTPDRPATMTVPAGYSSNENASGGRLILIVVDQPNIRFGGTLGIRKAINGFIDRLQPSDRTAVIGLGLGAPSTSFTADRDRLKKTIERLVGQHVPRGIMLHSIGVGEAMDIMRGNNFTLGEVIRRECVNPRGGALEETELDACQFEVDREARDIAMSGAADGRDTIGALRALLTALKNVDVPKTLIFVSEGFLTDGMQQEVTALGTLAAAARTSIYALKLDDTFFQMAASETRLTLSRMDDRAARAEGLEILTGASRGRLFNVVGSATTIFERIESELSGYYLIGVESGASDKDGKAHPIAIAIDARRKGLSVRTRRALIASADVPAPRNPREAVIAALATPMLLAALPIRVATYSLQGPEVQRVQLLIHADVGTDYPSSRVVSLGYVITDLEGRMVDSQAATARLPPVMNGVPSALQFSGGASLPPGEYLLKMAVAEGDRVGTVEHTFRAGVVPAGPIRVSDLMIGGPVNMGQELLQPTIGYSVVFGSVHGYVEAYGVASSSVTAVYEVAADADGPAILNAEVPPRTAGAARVIFTSTLPVRQLPPGKYYLRARLSSGSVPLKTLTGAFEVSTPAVLMTSASNASGTVASEVYLPVTESLLSKPFTAADALAPATVQIFRDRVLAASRPAFDQGVQALSAGAYTEAEASFKRAVSVDGESAAALSYMAATFAASGHDREASSAWQTALVDGSDLPEIYDWLAGTLMRNRDLGLARGVLEEAVGKWPSDLRFARPIALVYATFGQGQEAVRSLERYLVAHPGDVESMLMGVEWIYQLRSAGVVAHSPAEDLAVARGYAEAYAAMKGPQVALVKQWMEFLERRK